MYPVSTNTYHDVTNLVEHWMVKNRNFEFELKIEFYHLDSSSLLRILHGSRSSPLSFMVHVYGQQKKLEIQKKMSIYSQITKGKNRFA